MITPRFFLRLFNNSDDSSEGNEFQIRQTEFRCSGIDVGCRHSGVCRSIRRTICRTICREIFWTFDHFDVVRDCSKSRHYFSLSHQTLQKEIKINYFNVFVFLFCSIKAHGIIKLVCPEILEPNWFFFWFQTSFKAVQRQQASFLYQSNWNFSLQNNLGVCFKLLTTTIIRITDNNNEYN